MNGVVEQEFLRFSDGNEGLSYANVTFGYLKRDTGTLQFGVEGGFEVFDYTEGTQTAIYVAFVMSALTGDLQIGIPRPVLDTYVQFPDIAGNRLYGAQQGVMNRSLLGFQYLFTDYTPFGLRYDGQFNRLKIGISAHKFDGANATATEIAVNYDLDPFTIIAGAQYLTDRGFDSTGLMLGGKAEFDRVQSGVLFSWLDADGTRYNSVEGYVTYAAMDNLDLTLSAVDTDYTFGATPATYVGLSADYRFYKGAFLQAGVLSATGGGSDEVYDLTLGWQF